LVFVQNGYLESFLQSKGLTANTQALLCFAVSKRGLAPVDGCKTSDSSTPQGSSCCSSFRTKVKHGKWSEALAERIKAAGLTCEIVAEDYGGGGGDDGGGDDDDDAEAQYYRVAMFEKLIWLDSFMLVGALNGGPSTTVGDVERDHRQQVFLF
jgi:hypothetical protein